MSELFEWAIDNIPTLEQQQLQTLEPIIAKIRAQIMQRRAEQCISSFPTWVAMTYSVLL